MSETLRYRGKLQLSGNQRSSLVVDLRIQDGALILLSSDESLGAWPVEEVTASRISGDHFTIKLGIEEAVFVADDALAFSYEGLPALEREAELHKDRRRLRKKRDKSVRRLLSERNGRKAETIVDEPVSSAPRPAVAAHTDPYDDWLPAIDAPAARQAPRPRPTEATSPKPAPAAKAPAQARARTARATSDSPTARTVEVAAPRPGDAPIEVGRAASTTTDGVSVEPAAQPRVAATKAAAKPAAAQKPVARTAKPIVKTAKKESVAVLPTVIEVKAPERPAGRKAVAVAPARSTARSASPSAAPPPVMAAEPMAATAPSAPVPKPAGIRLVEAEAPAQPVRGPAQRNWKRIDEPAPSAAAVAQQQTANREPPERLRKRAGQGGFSRQMEVVEPTEGTTPDQPLKKAWKRALAGGPVVAGGLREAEPVERISVAPVSDPFGTNVAAYGIRSRPSGLSARLKRTKQAEEPHEHVWVQQTLTAGLVRRVCDDCGQVSLDLTEEEAAARLKA